MKMTAITNGWFASNGSGNFVARNAKNEQYFAPKRIMEALGLNEDEEIKFPLFAITGDQRINESLGNGEYSEEVTVRPTVFALYKSEDEMIAAYNADSEFEIKAKVRLAATAKEAGLNDAAVKALLQAAI